MDIVTVKRGDTLALLVKRKNFDGSPRTGEASKLKSQIKNSKDILAAEFVITETNVPGDYSFVVNATITETLPLGNYNCDIQFSDGGFVQSTETFKIIVEKDVTEHE